MTILWFLKFGSVCRRIVCHKILSWGGVKCEEFGFATVTLASLFMFFILGGGAAAGYKSVVFVLDKINEGALRGTDIDSTENIAAISRTQNPYAQRSETTPVDKTNDTCNLFEGTWNLWLGEMNRDVRDKSLFFLPENTAKGLFKYSGDVDASKPCEFVFIPRGDNAINYVIVYNELFEVVVGDNDFETVSLKASSSVGGPFEKVKEKTTEEERPKLGTPIQAGSTVKITLHQGFIGEETENNDYEVHAQISYLSANKNHTEDFYWRFVISPALHLAPTVLTVGLINPTKGSSRVGASFLSPDPDYPSSF